MQDQGGAGKTVITEDVEIVGTVKAGSEMRLDGKLNGDLNCAGDVMVGKSGSVKGNISINSVTVEGQVNGNIVARDRIELKATARINGDIKAKRLTVEDGVSFLGKAEVSPSGVAGRTTLGDSLSSRETEKTDDVAGMDAESSKSRGGLFSGRK